MDGPGDEYTYEPACSDYGGGDGPQNNDEGQEMDVDFVVQKGGNTSIATIRNDLSNNGIASDSDGAFRVNIGNNGNLFGTDEACTGAF